MKKTIILGTVGLLAMSSCVSKKHHAELIEKHNKTEKELSAMKEAATKAVSLETEIDKVSYSLGVSVASNVKQQGLGEINSKAFAEAVNDVYEGKTTQINPAEAQQTLQAFFQKNQGPQGGDQATGDNGLNKAAGEKFLAANAKNPGVVTTASGLQYVIMKAGTGVKPGPTSKVKTHYHGTLIDGTVFDSSVDRGQPISFPVNGVIKGWTEALQLMPVGSKWKLFIPYNLAYGARGAGAKIGPYSALVFEVELLGIE